MLHRTTRSILPRLLAIAGLLSTSLPLAARPPARPPARPAALPIDAAPSPQSAVSRHAMVAAANPHAVAAGMEILRAGGDAIDAAVAIAATLGLVEPQSSGLGGGAFLTYYDAKAHHVIAYDGREVAPMGATRALFLGEDGKPLSYGDAVLGGGSTGVPGAIAMLAMAHRQHGHLPWARLFAPARRLAVDGFAVSPRLARLLRFNAPQNSAPDVLHYFARPDGSLMQAGDILRNPTYAATLDTIAAHGVAGLLTGRVANDIIARLSQGPRPSTMTLADLAGYQPHVGPALCRPYRAYTICTPNAPSGGLPLQEALSILATTDIAARNSHDPTAWFTFAQASRLAYADRERYEGDPAFVTVPVAGLLAPDYAATRAAQIGTTAGPVTFGIPAAAVARGPDHTAEPGGTTHMVIVDPAGNVVSMTTTVESLFGSGRMVDGFFLNNQLTDFSFAPADKDGSPAANAVGPGKRPRSTMSPTIVLDANGRFVEALGSPGGSAIMAYVLKGVVATLDWHMTPQAAVSLPNLVARGDNFSADPFAPPIMDALAARNLPLSTARGEDSGMQIIARRGGEYIGGADPRREGIARGF